MGPSPGIYASNFLEVPEKKTYKYLVPYKRWKLVIKNNYNIYYPSKVIEMHIDMSWS